MKSKIFLFGTLALLLSACGEEFLNVPSQTALTSEVFFKTEADFFSEGYKIPPPSSGNVFFS